MCKEGKNEVKLDMELVYLLQRIRDRVGKPVKIISGYRSYWHNRKVGGAPKSQHLYGKAADIKVRGIRPIDLARIAEQEGAEGIGVYPVWVHVDVRGYKARWGAVKVSKKISKGKLDYTAVNLKYLDDFLRI